MSDQGLDIAEVLDRIHELDRAVRDNAIAARLEQDQRLQETLEAVAPSGSRTP